MAKVKLFVPLSRHEEIAALWRESLGKTKDGEGVLDKQKSFMRRLIEEKIIQEWDFLTVSGDPLPLVSDSLNEMDTGDWMHLWRAVGAKLSFQDLPEA